jgi:hypothetical protein
MSRDINMVQFIREQVWRCEYGTICTRTGLEMSIWYNLYENRCGDVNMTKIIQEQVWRCKYDTNYTRTGVEM